MIPFEEIDSRLERLGKNRAWLVEVTGRSPESIRAALAPNALPSKRSKLLQKALSDAIEAEEAEQWAQPERVIPPGHVEFVLTDTQYKRAQIASRIAGFTSFADFCRVAIEQEVEHIMERQAEKTTQPRKSA